MVLKLSKIVSFLQFLTIVSKKLNAVIAIYVYVSESSRFALLENDIVIMLWLRVWKILTLEVDKFRQIFAESALSLIFYSSIFCELLLRPQ